MSSSFINWSAWGLDLFTWGWIFWITYFIVWETAGVLTGVQNTLTWHLRPVFHAAPLTWWLALGAWLWLGIHLLWPAAEQMIKRTVGA